MNYTVVINCAVWFGALGYYFIDARKWFTGPKMTVETEEVVTEGQAQVQVQVLRDEAEGLEEGHGAKGFEEGDREVRR